MNSIMIKLKYTIKYLKSCSYVKHAQANKMKQKFC